MIIQESIQESLVVRFVTCVMATKKARRDDM